ncbi:MAG: cation:proton antiporter [Balneolaceae bacterium]
MENSYPVFFEFDFYVVQLFLLACVVLLILLVAPRVKSKRYITSPIFFLLLGMVLFLLPIPWELPELIDEPVLLKRITEFGVIVALASAGLKINNPFSWKTWSSSARLLLITMPLTIAATAFLGWWVAGLVPASALLLGAVLAPTDPVLANDVQTSDPGTPDDSSVRLTLTTEAGLNDGLAFPFTNLAIAVAVLGLPPSVWIVDWLLIDVLYKIIIGGIAGVICGKILGFLLFNLQENQNIKIADDVFAIALVLFPYATAELISSYGFIAVFVSASIFRQKRPEHEYQKKVHRFSVTMEGLVEGILMLIIGGYLVFGVLEPLTVPMIAVSLVIIFLVRPISGLIAFTGSDLPKHKKWVVSFFGIRGIGSLYYLSYAIYMADFYQSDELWAITMFIVTVSVLVHGVTAKPVMERFGENK